MKIKLLVLTGIRSEYDLLYPLLKEVKNSEDFELGIVVSGAHLTPLHNYSFQQVEKDGFKIVGKIDNLFYSNTASAKAKSTGVLLQSLAEILANFKPDYLVVLGDREEPVIGALAATYMDIPVIHIAGGDHTIPEHGDVDEQIRHATSKLSHIHLVMHEEHKQRLLKMGEEEWRVFVVGNGGIDRIRETKVLAKEELAKAISNNINEDYAVVIYHPLSSEMAEASQNLKLILDTLLELDLKIFIGNPNSDPGYENLLEVIQTYSSNSNVYNYSNLDRELFVNLLRHSKLLIGNSSLGVLEAPYLRLSAINVGERQKGRICGNNIQFIAADSDELRASLEKVLLNSEINNNNKEEQLIYGDGNMAKKTISILRNLPSKEQLLAKKNTY
ncbi:UDP-N-acetylglucosamine 2-epimerase [Lysinibacillus sp. NPDC096212]|uniref:UDP-N-acetylglucosamine 2-epimerase n=1 Tax=Lysinibacillus sp. NPDC096212 TaxID=3364135 RepID=UPI0037F88595